MAVFTWMDIHDNQEVHIHGYNPPEGKKKPAPAEEPEAEEEPIEEGPEDNEMVRRLLPIFYNNRAEVLHFVHAVDGVSARVLTDYVNRLLREGKISKAACKKELWSILHEFHFYPYSSSNWNSRVNA